MRSQNSESRIQKLRRDICRRRGFVDPFWLLTSGFSILPLAAWPVRMEFMPGWLAAVLFVAGALPIVWLGMRSLGGLGPARKWTAISVRLIVFLLFVLILGGIRWQRQHRDLEVMVLRDVSTSVSQVRDYPGKSLTQSVDDWLMSLSKDESKRPDDRMGVIRFQHDALIEALPSPTLRLDARAIPREPRGTDAAAAIQLALATMSRDAMHRFLLLHDGNNTSGDLEAAIAAAVSQHVPIDVVPLRYNVENEVLLDRFVAPTWKRENEPFTLDVVLRSTNPTPVTGKLQVMHQGKLMDLDPTTPQVDETRLVTLKPGLNRQSVRVPALGSAGVHEFRAIFEGENLGGAGGVAVDTLDRNNFADAFTFVRGKGQILYVDNAIGVAGDDRPGEVLAEALASEGITLKPVNIDQFPRNVIEMQNYDAVILANVPRGAGGLNVAQEEMLASYVHDMGGGLVMIGGPDTFGAGAWQGSKLEQVLPVDMDIPAQRQIGKGALALIMHSCEMPDGNYWGEQCAHKAIETLGERDEIAVVSYGWNGGRSGFDFPLAEKGDGGRVHAAVKKMQLGDMPSFDDSMNVALNGIAGTSKGLKDSDARHKHAIIISDGDPQAPAQALIDAYKKAKISVSTVTVYPHMGGANALPPTMQKIAADLGGRAYGPINANPSQLPQIFIKEATIVRRSLIHEDSKGIGMQVLDASDELIKGLGEFPPLFGMVLTSRKNDPKVVMPISAGKNNDPILAHWQAGLGRAAVFTGDAHNRWASQWVASPSYSKFWAQLVRGVARPPMSSDFDVQVVRDGDKAKVVVEALNRDDDFLNFLNISGTVVGPGEGDVTDGSVGGQKVRLVQTGPGTYEAEFDTKDAGNYVVALNYRGKDGNVGMLLSGLSNNTSAELRDLRSNDAKLREIADRTGGVVLDSWVTPPPELSPFRRGGLTVTASPLPVWDLLLPFLLGAIILDVAVRRIAWDWNSVTRAAVTAREFIKSFTTTRQVETRETLDALSRVRREVAETKFKTGDGAAPATKAAPAAPAARPDPRAKFQAKEGGVEGDITKVVGGATDKPVPPPPRKIEPKGAPAGAAGGHTSSLLEAKRRAQQAIRQKEQGE